MKMCQQIPSSRKTPGYNSIYSSGLKFYQTGVTAAALSTGLSSQVNLESDNPRMVWTGHLKEHLRKLPLCSKPCPALFEVEADEILAWNKK